MITIQKEKIIEDEKMRDTVCAVISEREEYYKTLFASAREQPQIIVRFENFQPFRLRITFKPCGEKPIMIDTQGYTAPDIVTKHAFKKLRRVAKNYFTKKKKRHRYKS